LCGDLFCCSRQVLHICIGKILAALENLHHQIAIRHLLETLLCVSQGPYKSVFRVLGLIYIRDALTFGYQISAISHSSAILRHASKNYGGSSSVIYGSVLRIVNGLFRGSFGACPTRNEKKVLPHRFIRYFFFRILYFLSQHAS
jgi:hypothetical protein